jgi:hypothetical protein
MSVGLNSGHAILDVQMHSLIMQRGKKSVFIGLFPSVYRAEVVQCNLEWCPSWKPVIETVVVKVAM